MDKQSCIRTQDVWRRLLLILAAIAVLVGSDPATAGDAPAGRKDETVGDALCRLIDGSAAANHLPVNFLTRLIWQESRFKLDAVSHAGAQGVAQFMPGTALERGLLDPFDPEQAIPASAALLADLARRFGNLGLAAAAYNGGPRRVSDWLGGTGNLAFETRDYVVIVTGQTVDDWALQQKTGAVPPPTSDETCTAIAGRLRTSPMTLAGGNAPFAAWGVQLAGNFSKYIALASYMRAQNRYKDILGDIRPMVIGTRLRSRGFRPFYRVRVPADTRQVAMGLCSRIRAVHGNCIVLRS